MYDNFIRGKIFMKRAVILFLTLILSLCNITFASGFDNGKEYDFGRDYQCSELIQKIRMQKNTFYNVLGLSKEQQELKDKIEAKRLEEMQPYIDRFHCEQQNLRELAKTSYKSKEYKAQYKKTHKAWRELHKGMKKYDKEFKKTLCSSQRTKYNEIVKLTRRDVRYCYLNKKACPKNPYINTFGKSDARPICNMCKKHSHPHIFGHECEK